MKTVSFSEEIFCNMINCPEYQSHLPKSRRQTLPPSTYLSRFASSINGLFSPSVNSFHCAPRFFDISELCILGLSCAIFRRCPRDHTMKAFIGRLMCSLPGAAPPPLLLLLLLLPTELGVPFPLLLHDRCNFEAMVMSIVNLRFFFLRCRLIRSLQLSTRHCPASLTILLFYFGVLFATCALCITIISLYYEIVEFDIFSGAIRLRFFFVKHCNQFTSIIFATTRLRYQRTQSMY